MFGASAPSLPDAYNQAVHGVAIGPGVGSCGTAAYRNETVIVEDISTDPLRADYKEPALAHGRDADTLISRADTAMYQAKKKGNTYVFSPESSAC